MTKDDIMLNLELSNKYLKYYQDIRCDFINSTLMTVVYPRNDSLLFGYISFKDMEVDGIVLEDVPSVTQPDGTTLYNNGSNFIIVR